MACFGLEDPKKPKNMNDEIECYELARYISSTEAVWRTLCFDVHTHYPPVEQLAVHVPNQRVVTFDPSVDNPQTIQDRNKETTLTGFFLLCQEDDFAKTLMYADVPQHYRWEKGIWKKRKNESQFKLGRVYAVHPSQMEAFCLRLLLFKVPGPTSYEFLRTVDNVVYETFQEACRQHGLLEDDSQYNDAMINASYSDSPKKMRELFCYIMTNCPDVTDRLLLWNNHKHDMSEDILYEERKKNPEKDFDDSIFNKCLILIEDRILQISGKDLSEFYGLPIPNRTVQRVSVEEKRETYDLEDLDQFVDENLDKLTDEQQNVFDTIISNLDHGGLWFLDAPGGTGKTFVTKLILAEIRRRGHKCLAVASSGIAATLLPGGRTAHSTFKLPLDLARQETPTCNIMKNTMVAKMMKKIKLIVWDECTM